MSLIILLIFICVWNMTKIITKATRLKCHFKVISEQHNLIHIFGSPTVGQWP